MTPFIPPHWPAPTTITLSRKISLQKHIPLKSPCIITYIEKLNTVRILMTRNHFPLALGNNNRVSSCLAFLALPDQYTNLPDDFFCCCQNNHMGILMWQEEKQHMIWMMRGETNISLLRHEPHCPSPNAFRKVHQTTNLIAVPWHESHSTSPSAQSCLSRSDHILPGVDSAQTVIADIQT